MGTHLRSQQGATISFVLSDLAANVLTAVSGGSYAITPITLILLYPPTIISGL